MTYQPQQSEDLSLKTTPPTRASIEISGIDCLAFRTPEGLQQEALQRLKKEGVPMLERADDGWLTLVGGTLSWGYSDDRDSRVYIWRAARGGA
jgi:hypothetical protein